MLICVRLMKVLNILTLRSSTTPQKSKNVDKVVMVGIRDYVRKRLIVSPLQKVGL
jgi:hypothetical protein